MKKGRSGQKLAKLPNPYYTWMAPFQRLWVYSDLGTIWGQCSALAPFLDAQRPVFGYDAEHRSQFSPKNERTQDNASFELGVTDGTN